MESPTFSKVPSYPPTSSFVVGVAAPDATMQGCKPALLVRLMERGNVRSNVFFDSSFPATIVTRP